MSDITMGQLAGRLAVAASKVQPVSEEKLRTLAEVGVGLMKSEIQDMHAVDTGTMLNSTQAEQTSKTSFLIGPTVHYAPYVALGTSRMMARPFHLAAAAKLREQASTILGAEDLGL